MLGYLEIFFFAKFKTVRNIPGFDLLLIESGAEVAGAGASAPHDTNLAIT